MAGMEEEDVVVLTDEEGREHEFAVVDMLELDGKEYAVLLPFLDEEEEEDEEAEAVILRVEKDADGEEVLVDIEDDAEWERVADEWERLIEEEEEAVEEEDEEE